MSAERDEEGDEGDAGGNGVEDHNAGQTIRGAGGEVGDLGAGDFGGEPGGFVADVAACADVAISAGAGGGRSARNV